MKKIKCLIAVALMISLFAGCSKQGEKEKNKYVEDFKYGVIVSGEQKDDAYIECLDEDLNSVGKYHIDYNIDGYGVGMPFVYDDKLYCRSIGYGGYEDNCNAIIFDYKTGTYETIHFDDCVALTDIKADENYIYGVSNLNWKNHIYRYSRKNKEMEEIIIDGTDALYLYPCDGEVYVYVWEKNGEKVQALHRVDFENGSLQKIKKISKYAPQSFVNYDKKLYLPCDKEMVVYDTVKDEISKYSIPVKNAYSCCSHDNIVYVLDFDMRDRVNPSKLVAFDMNLNEVVNTYELEPDVDSVCMDENVILASDGMGTVFKFELNEQEGTLEKVAEHTVYYDDYFYPAICINTAK